MAIDEKAIAIIAEALIEYIGEWADEIGAMSADSVARCSFKFEVKQKEGKYIVKYGFGCAAAPIKAESKSDIIDPKQIPLDI